MTLDDMFEKARERFRKDTANPKLKAIVEKIKANAIKIETENEVEEQPADEVID